MCHRSERHESLRENDVKAESKTEELWNNRAYKASRDLGKAQSDTPDCLLLSNILDRSSVTDSAVTRAPSSYSDTFCHWRVMDHVRKARWPL